MNKKICKLTATISAVTLAFASMLTSAAYAANISDTDWDFSTGYIREKQDYSSIYVKNTSDVNASVSVYAYTYTQGGKIHDASKFNGSTLKTKDVPIPARSERLVKQFIYELGYRYAYVYFTGPGSHGCWSPDSIGSYPSAN